jgi:hypothetical protein
MPYWWIYIVGAVVVGAVVIWSRMRLAKGMAESADKAVAAVAARLSMSVVEGDPRLNLYYFQQPSSDFERRIRAEGQPYGRPARWTVVDGQKTNEYLVVRTVTRTFGCFLEVRTGVRFPPFEAFLRSPNQYLIPEQDLAERRELAETRTGDVALDARLVVRAADPRIGPVLAPALRILCDQQFVHLAGADDRLWISFTRYGLPYFAHAAEHYLLAVETAACALEGRPIPAQPIPAIAATPAY